jgi:hypothetical protein
MVVLLGCIDAPRFQRHLFRSSLRAGPSGVVTLGWDLPGVAVLLEDDPPAVASP